jgi:ankyrin repeat protein
MNKIKKVLEDCQNTGSWYGIKIHSVNERNEFGDTPLHTVCSWGDLDSVKVLLEAGANINAQGEHGATPIFNGVMSKNLDLVKMLLTRGARKDAKIFGSISLRDYAEDIGASKEILALLKK